MFSQKTSSLLQVHAVLYGPSPGLNPTILAVNNSQVSENFEEANEQGLSREKEAFLSRSKIDNTPIKPVSSMGFGFNSTLDVRYPKVLNSQEKNKKKDSGRFIHSFDRVFPPEPKSSEIFETVKRIATDSFFSAKFLSFFEGVHSE